MLLLTFLILYTLNCFPCLSEPSSWASFDISNSLQVKAFSRSLESIKTAIVVGGTNIAEQVSNFGKINHAFHSSNS